MKYAAKLLVVVSSALLLVIVTAASWRVNGNVKVLKSNHRAISVLADGSMPIPPPPKGTGLSITATPNTAWADGSMPIPPPPKGTGLAATATSNDLLADGSMPIPPPPPPTTGPSASAILPGNSLRV